MKRRARLADRTAAAFVYGCVANGTEYLGSDTDLLVIADELDCARLYDTLPQRETALGRPINPTDKTMEEGRRY